MTDGKEDCLVGILKAEHHAVPTGNTKGVRARNPNEFPEVQPRIEPIDDETLFLNSKQPLDVQRQTGEVLQKLRSLPDGHDRERPRPLNDALYARTMCAGLR